MGPAETTRPARVRQTIRDAFALQGRATRTEFADYVFVALLVTVVVTLVAGFFAPLELRDRIGNILACAIAVPVPALLVRRFHDQNRTGRWVWLAIFLFVLWAVRTVWSASLGIEARIGLDRTIWPLDWLAMIASVITVVLVVLPGTVGPNRFGADPRRQEA